jgi:hypothetical protein
MATEALTMGIVGREATGMGGTLGSREVMVGLKSSLAARDAAAHSSAINKLALIPTPRHLPRSTSSLIGIDPTFPG